VERKEPLTGEAERFLARWSRRKREGRDGVPGVPEAESAPPSSASEPPAEPAPRVLTDADMPPIGSLRYDDDWSGFLSPGVSERLRGEALRRLFSSPELNVSDGLDSYSGDYTQFEALGDTVTADMRHQIDRLLDRPDPAEAGDREPPATASAGDLGPETRHPEPAPPPADEPQRRGETNDINDLELKPHASAG